MKISIEKTTRFKTNTDIKIDYCPPQQACGIMPPIMRPLASIFQEKDKTFSFELFPPKTDKGFENLKATIDELKKLEPDFISVTYGAGGGNRERTLQIVDLVQKQHQIIGVAHLTCVLHSKKDLDLILQAIKSYGIRNVLALRGDPPKGLPEWKPDEDNFSYSCELVAFMRQRFGDFFSIGVAGFPEGHPLAPNRQTDAKYLKTKIDSGADFIVTQFFFNNQDYFDYVKRLRELGVNKRIIPGILPITNYRRLVDFAKDCGATVPDNVRDLFESSQDDPKETLKKGTDFAINQCRELLKGKAPGIHFYCLNKIEPVATILKAVRS